MGGNGKTSVAIEIARSFREMDFQYVVWHTASTKHRSTPMTFDTIIDEIAKQLSFPELLATQGDALERKTREILSNQKVLLVLDNMETSGESQNEIAARLSEVLGNSKVLFTSRNRFDTLEVDVWDYNLQGLQKEASIQLMEQVAKERNITCFDTDNSGSLLKLTGNNKTGYLPLALKLVTGQLKNKTTAEIEQSLFNVRLTENDVQADDLNLFKKFWWRMFFQSFNMLSPSDLDLMLFLASLKEQEGTTKDMLLSLTKEILTEEQFFQATENTWRLCLLEREEYYNQRYYLHILTSTFFNKIIDYTRRIIQ